MTGPPWEMRQGDVLERLREWGQAEMKKLRDAFRPLVDKLRDE